MLAVKVAFVDGSEGAGAAPAVRAAAFVSTAGPQRRFAASSGSRRTFAITATAVVHAVVLALVLDATSREPATRPPPRLEVALIAPERKPPPPPPPTLPKRPLPLRQTAAPALPLPLPRIAEPMPPMPVVVPAPLAEPKFESPIIAITAPAPTESPPAPPAPAVVIAAPPPELVPPRFDAAYLDNPAPRYPASARRALEEGRVLLRVLVSADGRPLRVDVATSSGSDALDAAAIDAVRRWRFVPARRGDVAVDASVQVPIVFSLRR